MGSHQHLETTTAGWNLGFSKIVHKISFFPDRYNHQLPLEQFSVSVKKVIVPYICFERKSCCPICYISSPVPPINHVCISLLLLLLGSLVTTLFPGITKTPLWPITELLESAVNRRVRRCFMSFTGKKNLLCGFLSQSVCQDLISRAW